MKKLIVRLRAWLLPMTCTFTAHTPTAEEIEATDTFVKALIALLKDDRTIVAQLSPHSSNSGYDVSIFRESSITSLKVSSQALGVNLLNPSNFVTINLVGTDWRSNYSSFIVDSNYLPAKLDSFNKLQKICDELLYAVKAKRIVSFNEKLLKTAENVQNKLQADEKKDN